MAVITTDRVLETSVTTGTDVILLDGAVDGYLAVSDELSDGDTADFFIEAVNVVFDGVNTAYPPTGLFQTFRGTYTSATNSLSIDSIYKSSDSGAQVSFSSGTKLVGLTVTGSRIVTPDSIHTLTNKSGAISQWTNDSGYLTIVAVPTWASVLGSGNTSGGTNPIISAGDELRFRDAGLTIDSPTDGEMEITADTLLTLTGATVSIADGFRVDLPSSGAMTDAFFVDTSGNPGIAFDRPTSTTGQIVVQNGGTISHLFGAAGTIIGDVGHTDGTNSMTYDASLNVLALTNGGGAMKLPTMTTTQRNAMTPAAGWIIFNTTTSKHEGYDGSAWNAFY